jgi:hypothetical protein
VAILRGTLPTDGFTIVQNAWLRDPALSARAKGLLCYMASHAEGYVLTVAQMRREMKDGEDSIRSALAELEAAGYLTKERQRDGTGKLGAYEWTLGVSAGQNQTGLPSQGGPGWATPSPKKTTEEKTTKEDHQPSSDAAASPNAGLIIKGFIDWLAARPEPVKLTPSVIARYGKAIKALLQANYDVDTIKRALALQTERGKAGWPSMLDSFCVEVQNRPTSGAPAGASKPFVQQADEYKADKEQRFKARALVIDEAMEAAAAQGVKVTIPEVVALVDNLIESGQIDLDDVNGLKKRAVSLYSGHQSVITVDAEEVAGS